MLKVVALANQAVDAQQPPRFTLREDRSPGVTDSWRSWYEAKEVEEWIQSVAGVLDQGWNDQYVSPHLMHVDRS